LNVVLLAKTLIHWKLFMIVYLLI